MRDDQDPGMLMLLGNPNLMIGNTTDAKKNFLDLISRFDELDVPAKWYLSLCYLRNGEVQPAIDLLKEIQTTPSPYAGKAGSLLRELE
jgi:hypothetical protein